MILVDILVLSFRQILTYFFLFYAIAISEITHFGLSKTFFTFPQNFSQVLG